MLGWADLARFLRIRLFQGAHDIRLMYAIFVCMGVLGIIATSFVPESYKQDFPECIEDISKRPNFPFFSFKVWDSEPAKLTEEEERENEEILKPI